MKRIFICFICCAFYCGCLSNNMSGTLYLKKMGDSEFADNSDELKLIIKAYYESYYSKKYSSLSDFLNLAIVTPDSIPTENRRLIGNSDSYNFGKYYLRYYIVKAYYGDSIISEMTQRYIDVELVYDNSKIVYGGSFRVYLIAKRHEDCMLKETLSDLINRMQFQKRTKSR